MEDLISVIVPVYNVERHIDDYFHYDFLRLMHAAITDGEGYDLAMCGMRITIHSKESCNHTINCQWVVQTSVSVFPSIFPPAPGPNVWNKLYRTSSIHNLRARSFPIAQDQDFNIQVFTQIKNIIRTGEVLYYWVRRDGQITQRARYFEIWPDILYRNYIDHQSEKDPWGYILLNQLYRRMALLKAYSIKTDKKRYFSKNANCTIIIRYPLISRRREFRIPIRPSIC